MYLRIRAECGHELEDLFRELIQRVCRQRGLDIDEDTAEHLLIECSRHSSSGLRACYPYDIMGIVLGMAAFEQRPPILDRQRIDEALKVYFVH